MISRSAEYSRYSVASNGQREVKPRAVFDPSERHYSAKELAASWNVSPDTIRRLFLDEPGVLIFERPRTGKRTYRPMRIPQSVADRVYVRIARC